jgi:hypothetical protein
MRMWRGGSPSSGLVGGRLDQAAREVGVGVWAAAAGGAGQVVQLGLVVNGPAGRGNREKLIFGGPLGFRRLVN